MEIFLTKDKVAVVDEIDYMRLVNYNWCYSNGYALNRGLGLMHIEIIMHQGIEIPIGYEVDHEDRNRSNNRRGNLRVVTRSVNSHNCGLRTNNYSGVKGVSYWSKRKKWLASIMVNGRRMYLGIFSDFKSACDARSKAEILFGLES